MEILQMDLAKSSTHKTIWIHSRAFFPAQQPTALAPSRGVFSLHSLSPCTSADQSMELLELVYDTIYHWYDRNRTMMSLHIGGSSGQNRMENNWLKTVERMADFQRTLLKLPTLIILNNTASNVDNFWFPGTTVSKGDTLLTTKAQNTLYFLQQLEKYNLPHDDACHFLHQVCQAYFHLGPYQDHRFL